MFILKNAYISITRNKGRNALIGVVILIIACACTVALAINNTAEDLINSYENAYEKELSITFNRENMRKNFDFSNKDSLEDAKTTFNKIATYSIDDVEKFAESDYIEKYYYTYSISLNGKSIEKAEAATDNGPNIPDAGPGGMPGKDGLESSTLDFTLTGYNSPESMNEFIDGNYTITELTDDAWEVAFNGNNAFINEELADYNDLSTGDKIKLQDEDGHTFEFKVIGIFKDNGAEESGGTSMFSSSVNTIITNSAALLNITNKNKNISGTINPTFVIYSYGDADTIQAEFYDKGLDENYIVQTNEEIASTGLSSVQNVKTFASTFLIITLIIGGVVLVTINMINIRERKYEIGVFRTIGISKAKLTCQFVAELTMVAMVALALGAIVGAMMSKDVSNSLLSNEISNSATKNEDLMNNFGGGPDKANNGKMPDFNSLPGRSGQPNIQAYESIDAVVNLQVITELLAIGLSLVLISSLAAMISIQRFSPLTILKERS